MKKIGYIGGLLIRPALALPDQGRIVAIDLISDKEKVEMTNYVYLTDQSATNLYKSYQQFYRSVSPSKWHGMFKGENDLHYFAFSLRVQFGDRTPPDAMLMYTVANKANPQELKSYRLTGNDRNKTLISATFVCERMHDLLIKNSEFTLLI